MLQMELNAATTTEYSMRITQECLPSEDNPTIEASSMFNNKNNGNKSRRKSAIPQKSVPLGDCSLGEDSQASQSSHDESSNSTEEHLKDEDQKLPNKKKENKSKCDIKCNMCEKLFQYKSEFDRHYGRSYNQTPVYTCMFCDKTMEKYSTFRSHCYRHVTVGRFKCDDCGKSFNIESHLKMHIIGKHIKEKPFSCEECGKCFSGKAGLRIHMKKHLVGAKEDYPCAECGKILHTRGGLTAHMNVHRLGRCFMCDVCGKTFTQKVNMQQHVKLHTGDKPYECNICGKTFLEKSHLSRHLSLHTTHRPFKCEVCGKMYKTERCLKVHSQVHGTTRPYVCSYCNKGFLSRTKLKQHSNIHTGERPYECKFCERKFTNYPNLLKHTRRKHNPVKIQITEASSIGEFSEALSDLTSSSLNPVKLEIKTEFRLNEANVDKTDVLDYDNDDTGFILQPSLSLLPHLESTEPIHYDHLTTDFKLSKTDELFLQKGILNFPVTDIEPKEEALQMVHI